MTHKHVQTQFPNHITTYNAYISTTNYVFAWATWQLQLANAGGWYVHNRACRNTFTCSVKAWWWPPAIQQTFITCHFMIPSCLLHLLQAWLFPTCIHTITSPRVWTHFRSLMIIHVSWGVAPWTTHAAKHDSWWLLMRVTTMVTSGYKWLYMVRHQSHKWS